MLFKTKPWLGVLGMALKGNNLFLYFFLNFTPACPQIPSQPG